MIALKTEKRIPTDTVIPPAGKAAPSDTVFEHRRIQAFLLSLTDPGGDLSRLPDITLTLPLAEQVHRTLIGRAARGRTITCPELTGQNPFGQPLTHGHRHAHILPLDLDNDHHLDHILIWSPMGLGQAARKAIQSLRHLNHDRRAGLMAVRIVGCGHTDHGTADGHTLRWQTAHTQRVSTRRLLPGRVRHWISATPFVPPRYIRKTARHSPEGQIQAELASRDLPAAESIEILPDRSAAMASFVCARSAGRRRPPVKTGFAVRLRFASPLAGPLALGYGCHFGLGLFQADDGQRP